MNNSASQNENADPFQFLFEILKGKNFYVFVSLTISSRTGRKIKSFKLNMPSASGATLTSSA